ncbi:heavy-metal-associated domain-containing protein [Natronospora cellulosivora (SeqCode)]
MERTIKIKGMTCHHCEAHVKDELEKVSGVEAVEVSAVNNNAVVTLIGDVDDSKLKEAVEEAGYEILGIE